jgi:putative serine protease PepD
VSRIRLPLAILALSGVVALVVAFNTGQQARLATASPNAALAPAAAAAQLQANFVSVYRKVAPSVVQIETSSGLGSGIVFDRKGHIVTNAHVVGNATSFTVTPWKRGPLKATLVGKFEPDDLAVIKVPSSAGLRPAIFANSAKLRVGDIAMAIGNPLGLSSSVTQGIVSFIGRSASAGGGVTLPNTIQTSAAINPGNSGGALADIQGRVIGVPTLAASDPFAGGTAPGLGFAIPSNRVRDIAGQIVRNGRVVNSHRAFLGVTVGDTGDGVYVGSVQPGGPAAKAGIGVGDVIVSIGGKATPSSGELGSVLAARKPGQTVKVRIVRANGGSATVDLTLGEYPGG